MFSAATCSAILARASAGVTTPGHILAKVFMLKGMLYMLPWKLATGELT